MTRHLLHSLALASLLTACQGGSSPEPADGPRADQAAADQASPAADAPADVAAAETTVPEDWQGWVASQVDTVRDAEPERFNALMDLQPAPTRAGMLRFRGDLIRSTDAAAVLLHRLTTTSESTQVRAAIVEALPRTGADVGAALADLMTTETDDTVREMMADTLWRAPSDASVAALRRALGDASPGVRAAAARSAARHDKGTELSAELVAALRDTDDATRLAAIAAVGALKIDTAKEPLAAMLGDDEADVRLASLRALGRVDAEYAASRPELTALQADSDARVVTAANALAQ